MTTRVTEGGSLERQKKTRDSIFSPRAAALVSRVSRRLRARALHSLKLKKKRLLAGHDRAFLVPSRFSGLWHPQSDSLDYFQVHEQ